MPKSPKSAPARSGIGARRALHLGTDDGFITPSSGNVFEDLGFDAEEAANLKLRSTLAIELARYIEAEGLTQAAAAERLGVTQPRVSDLVRGKLDRFSIDSLVNMLARAGRRVEVSVTAVPAA